MDWIITTDTLRVGHLVTEPLENNVYIVACAATSTAVIIDAAGEGGRILSATEGLTVTSVLTTHGHFDHIGAVDDVTSALEIDFRMHPDDEEVAQRPPHEPFGHGDVIGVGELAVEVIHTPGHTPGSSCFLVDGVLFTGDTLFPGGPGVTRFPYSDFDQIVRSIGDRLFSYPDDTPFYPGHGPASTIGAERPSMPAWIDRRW